MLLRCLRFPLLLVVPALSLAQMPTRVVAIKDPVAAPAKLLSMEQLQTLGDALREGMEGLPRDRFSVMTRDNITELLPPGKTLEECSMGQCEVEIGRKLGADYLVVGRIVKIDQEYFLTTALHQISPKTRLLRTRKRQGKSVSALVGSLTGLGRELQEQILEAEGISDGGAGIVAPVPDREPVVALPAAGAAKRIAKFASEPFGAAVAVDGNPVCTTPCSKTLSEGSHVVAMALDGHRTQKKTVDLRTNGQDVSFQLEAIRTRLSLEAVDERTGDALVADVYVDGAKVGQTPFDGLVAVSAKTIEVAPAGFERKTVSITLEEGKVATATAKFRSAAKATFLVGSARRQGTPTFTARNTATGQSWTGRDDGSGIRFEVPAGSYEIKNESGCGWQGTNLVPVVDGETKNLDYSACMGSTEAPKPAGGMVQIPAGCFQMGSTSGDDDEKPVHQVCLDAFQMDATEVTQGAYRSLVGTNPSDFSSCGDNCPVENMIWTEAKSYCERIGKRLPTEAEWEYAARAGTTTKWYWGDDESRAGEYAWYHGNSGSTTHPVGQKQPNGWGLYDMSGNVYEWVSDWKDAYPSGDQRNPKGPASGSNRVLRGGSWGSHPPAGLRSAYRGSGVPSTRYGTLGFRCVGP